MGKTLLIWFVMATFTFGIVIAKRPADGVVVGNNYSRELLTCTLMWPLILGAIVGERPGGNR
jgi:hypothetical protein